MTTSASRKTGSRSSAHGWKMSSPPRGPPAAWPPPVGGNRRSNSFSIRAPRCAAYGQDHDRGTGASGLDTPPAVAEAGGIRRRGAGHRGTLGLGRAARTRVGRHRGPGRGAGRRRDGPAADPVEHADVPVSPCARGGYGRPGEQSIRTGPRFSAVSSPLGWPPPRPRHARPRD